MTNTLLDEIIVDNFAGGGGASTGIELALGRPVNIAINHDPAALLLHQTNHPHTEHLQASVWDIDPVKVCKGRPVGLAWFSPDCKHFSKAKGGTPVEKKIRGLAWIALRWAGTVRPRIIILENVEEFQTWGPVRHGKPVKSKAGQTFQKFIRQLENCRYEVQYRLLIAADYDAATIRKRFFMIARCDGQPIVWPEPSRSQDGINLPKWRSAAEIIDWKIPCPSIFDSKAEIKTMYGVNAIRPLADNTLRRIIRGVDVFTIKSGKPFIVVNNSSRSYANGSDIDNPVRTITTGGHQILVTPSIMAIGQTGGGDRIRGADMPIHTQVSKAESCIVAPSLIQYHSEKHENVRGQSLSDTLMTVDSANRYGLTAAHLTEYYGNAQHGLSLDEPMHTATAKDREGLTAISLTEFHGTSVARTPEEPLSSQLSRDHTGITAAHIVKFKGTNIGQGADEPMQTVTAGGHHYGMVYTTIVKAAKGVNLRNWTKIRALLNKYCGYSLDDDDVILLWIGVTAYFIADIGLRMLVPRELYNAQGFPTDYIIEWDYLGNVYNKTEQVAKCGNSVCPPVAKALVKANMPEYCVIDLSLMAELEKLVVGYDGRTNSLW